jgi:hypothetical protein
MPSKKSERTPAGEARVRKTASSLHLILTLSRVEETLDQIEAQEMDDEDKFGPRC